MSTKPPTPPQTTTTNLLEQQATATAEAYSNPAPTHQTTNRTGMFGPVANAHTKEELEAASIMLTLKKRTPSFEEAQAAAILLSLSRSDSSYSSDDERTITASPSPPAMPSPPYESDDERTITAEPSPDASPSR